MLNDIPRLRRGAGHSTTLRVYVLMPRYIDERLAHVGNATDRHECTTVSV